jgi:DNA modification methylase
MLTDVFAESVRKLEPGGRIAVNVANLGRKPYRSLSADVIRILEHDLGLLLRGELIWQKGEGASGSCAWGSFRSAANVEMWMQNRPEVDVYPSFELYTERDVELAAQELEFTPRFKD